MKIGLQIPYFTYSSDPAQLGPTFGRIMQDAEAAGFYSAWVMDHFFQLPGLGPKEDAMLEAYSALSYAAALTKRIKLGPLVVGVTYRQPGVLVKTATTLDVLSGGRSYFGVGAAWYEEEHNALGVRFPPTKERFERLEELLQIAHKMWSESAPPHEGQHYQLAETLNSPQALQHPHPPIMIGGLGEEKTFRFIARYGDACNIFSRIGLDEVARKYAVLQERCAEVDRPWAEIEKTTLSSFLVTPDGTRPADTYPTRQPVEVMSPTEVIEHLHQLAELGTDHAIFNTPIAHVPGALDVWAETIIPAVAKFVPAGR